MEKQVWQSKILQVLVQAAYLIFLFYFFLCPQYV